MIKCLLTELRAKQTGKYSALCRQDPLTSAKYFPSQLSHSVNKYTVIDRLKITV